MVINTEEQKQTKAKGRYIRMSPRKVRRVLNQIRGKSYQEALMLLEFMPYKACGAVWQVVFGRKRGMEAQMEFHRGV